MNNEFYDYYIEGGLTHEEAMLAVMNADEYTEIASSVAWYTLMGSFMFKESKQGHDFRYEIAERILNK